LHINEYTLAHEQGHFDICEYYSKKLFFVLESMHITAANIEFEAINLLPELQIEQTKMDELYDAETLHGTDFAKQEEWNKKIAQMLNEIIK
jgi:hypothetical protein